jgi:glutamate--cysteine ligase
MKNEGLIYSKEQYVEKNKAYFLEQSKERAFLLGAEMEHFLINRDTLRSYGYDEPGGQKEIMESLRDSGWNIIGIEDGNILGLEKEGSTVTLEPGGQIEFSLKPLKSVGEIDEAYRAIAGEIKAILRPEQALVSLGYHPKTKISELSLLPKKRYAMMFDYFMEHGRFCHNMMKGTASTQVSIDYLNEEDFIRKFRVANFISPVMANLFDSTPIFEGEKYTGRNCRTAIWEETDIKRSKLIPGSLDSRFDFEAYARYLLKIPPILLLSNGVVNYTKNQPLEELLGANPLTVSDLEHIQTMVFPDVRLKKYLEIRMADALPYPYNLSVVALIKALFYDAENLDELYELSLNYDDAWVRRQNIQLTKRDEVLDPDFVEITDRIMEMALKSLDSDERWPLEMLKTLRDKEHSMSSYLSRLYDQDQAEFVKSIEVLEDNHEN